MSDSPCTVCRSTSNGRLFYAYVNHYMSGDTVERRRLRLCRDCVFEFGSFLDGADYMENGIWVSVEVANRERNNVLGFPTRTVQPATAQSPGASGIPTPTDAEAGLTPTQPSAETATTSSVSPQPQSSKPRNSRGPRRPRSSQSNSTRAASES